MFGIYLQKITEMCGEKLKKMIKTLGQKSLCHYLCTRFWNFDDKTGDKNLHMLKIFCTFALDFENHLNHIIN